MELFGISWVLGDIREKTKKNREELVWFGEHVLDFPWALEEL